MSRLQQITKALKGMKALEESIGYKEIEEFLLNKEETNYFLNEVENDGIINSKEIILMKYILKNAGNHGFISPNKLQKDKHLYNELSSLILDNLGTNYILITMVENHKHYRSNDEMEHFNLIFRKTFATKTNGNIKTFESEKCSKIVSFGDFQMTSETNCMIGINFVSKNNLVYNGYSFKNQNVLFYGFNIEENPFLIKLFENQTTKKILNIIPISNSHSFYDNVD